MIKLEFKTLRENLYLIIPMVCLILWALLYLYNNTFYIDFPNQPDYSILYLCGKIILENPADIYNPIWRFYYLPIFGIVMGLTFSLFPSHEAHYLFLFTIIILAVLSAREYNRILILMNLNKKLHRFLFLMIISNGYLVYIQYDLGQFKYILLVIYLYIIRREMEYRKCGKEKDLKFYLINFNLLAIAIAIFPFFFFLLIIYVFYDIRVYEIFKKENVKKYILIITIFVLQNFLFFIYPSYFFDFLSLYERHNKSEREWGFPLVYLKEWEILKSNDYSLFINISTICIIIITLILILYKNLKIEQKFAYYSLACVIISAFSERTFVVLFPFVLLLFIPFLKTNLEGFEFIRKNKIVLIGLFSIAGIYLIEILKSRTFYALFPVLEQYSFIFILRYLILFLIFVSSLLVLYLRHYVIYKKN